MVISQRYPQTDDSFPTWCDPSGHNYELQLLISLVVTCVDIIMNYICLSLLFCMWRFRVITDDPSCFICRGLELQLTIPLVLYVESLSYK